MMSQDYFSTHCLNTGIPFRELQTTSFQVVDSQCCCTSIQITRDAELFQNLVAIDLYDNNIGVGYRNWVPKNQVDCSVAIAIAVGMLRESILEKELEEYLENRGDG